MKCICGTTMGWANTYARMNLPNQTTRKYYCRGCLKPRNECDCPEIRFTINYDGTLNDSWKFPVNNLVVSKNKKREN